MTQEPKGSWGGRLYQPWGYRFDTAKDCAQPQRVFTEAEVKEIFDRLDGVETDGPGAQS